MALELDLSFLCKAVACAASFATILIRGISAEEKEYTADEILDQAERYRSYWGSEGGITVSGGEPLLQIDFLIELFQKAKKRGIHTTLHTCGKPFTRDEPFFSRFQS